MFLKMAASRNVFFLFHDIFSLIGNSLKHRFSEQLVVYGNYTLVLITLYLRKTILYFMLLASPSIAVAIKPSHA